MTPVRCSQNHYYDSEVYSSCPHCAQASSKQPQSPSFPDRSNAPDMMSAGQGVTMPQLNNVAVPVYGSVSVQPQKKAGFFSRFGKKKEQPSQTSFSQNNTVPLNVSYTPDSVTEVLSDSPFVTPSDSGSDVFIRNQANTSPTYSDPQNNNIQFQGGVGTSIGSAQTQQEDLRRINASFPQAPMPDAGVQNQYKPQQPPQRPEMGGQNQYKPQQPPQPPQRPEMGGQNQYQPQQPPQPPQRPEMGGQNQYQPQQPPQPPQRPEMGGQNQYKPQQPPQPPQRPAANVPSPFPVAPANRPVASPATNVAPPVEQRKAAQSDTKTVAFYDLGDEEEPVVGWLVCVKGEYLGTGFNLSAGRNNIGRSSNMNIALPKCGDIERERHAVITFDPQKRKFYLQPGENSAATLINGKALVSYAELVAYDMILLGSVQFVFVPLCGERFAWDKFLY